MDTKQQIADHHAVLRRVMADSAMDPHGDRATINQPENFTNVQGRIVATTEREDLHEKWIQEVVQESANKAEIKYDGHAVVMAGAPGMGKGTIQREKFQDFPGYVACDPDKFKEKIIEHEYRTGNLASLDTPFMKELKDQGVVFAPMEYSTLVHQESSMLSKQLQMQLQLERANYIVDTVLKDVDSARDVLTRLDGQNYSYDVVSVQGTAAESKAGIYGRWEYDYRAYLEGKNELGGRPVPSEFANGTFPDPDGRSNTEHAAKWLAGNGVGVQSFTQYRRGSDMPEIDQVKIDGKLVERNSGQTSPSKSSEPSKPVVPRNRVSGINADFPHAAGRKQQRSADQKPYDSGRNAPNKDRGIER